MAEEVRGQYLTRNRRVSLLLAVLTALTVLIAPAASAGSVQDAGQNQTSLSGTWVGQVERHNGHFDYIGLPCPIETEFCIQIIVTYRIVPTTDQARNALPSVAGGRAKMEGTSAPGNDGAHEGVLFVQRVEKH